MSTANASISTRKTRNVQANKRFPSVAAKLTSSSNKHKEEIERVERLRKTIQRTLEDDGRDPFCLPIPRCGNLQSDSEAVINQNSFVRANFNVLHLRVPAHSAKYFRSHLSRWKPQHPLTIAVADSITFSNLLPSMPPSEVPLGLSFSESSASSSSSDLEFGVETPSIPIRLLVTDSIFMDLALTGQIGIASRKQTLRATLGPTRDPPRKYVALLNRRSGVPLAVCILNGSSTPASPIVDILACKPRRKSQQPVTTAKELGGPWSSTLPLYKWAQMRSEGKYPGQVRYSISFATGSGSYATDPSYRAVHQQPGSAEIKVVGRTGNETNYAACATLSLVQRQSDTGTNFFYKLSVSKGVDPALMVCLSSFVDEMIEENMRNVCAQKL